MKINKCLLATSSLIFSLICLNSVYANNFIIPEDAIEFNGHAYKFYMESLNWSQAKEICNNYGGHLVAITSKEENDFLINNIPQTDNSFYWIGATDEIHEGVWQWVTNETFSYNNWSEDSPNNNANKEHYAGFMTKEENYDGYPTPIGSWNDFQISVTGNNGYICEWDFYENTYINEESNANIKNQQLEQNDDSKQIDLDNKESQDNNSVKTNETEDDEIKSTDGINVTFHIDNMSLIGGLSIFGGISFIGFIIKKHKKDA